MVGGDLEILCLLSDVEHAFRRIELAEDVELVQGGDDHEDEVPDEQDDAELAVQPPPVEVGGHNQEDDGGEQAEGGVDESPALDGDGLARGDNGRLEEPGEPEADQDVEHIAADRVRDRHVAVAW